MRYFLLPLICLFTISLTAQNEVKKDTDFSIRANWNYQFFSFSGKRTNSMAFGGTLEKRINYESTLGLTVSYISRMEDGDEQFNSLPDYNEILYFSPFVRRYFEKAMKGPYTAFAMGIGIPAENGVQWDLGGHIGYLIQHERIAIDLMIQMGFGSYRYTVDEFTNNGIYVGNYSVYDYGFFFRPGLSLGFAF